MLDRMKSSGTSAQLRSSYPTALARSALGRFRPVVTVGDFSASATCYAGPNSRDRPGAVVELIITNGQFMLELNVVTAIPLGSFAAIVWSWFLLRRLLHAPRAIHLSRNQRLAVYLAGATALIPALIVGFVFGGFLSRVTVVPGVWTHLALALTMVFGLSVVGTIIPVAVGSMVAKHLLRQSAQGV
jgi:hypothetical protein